jgi:hypothetical protein
MWAAWGRLNPVGRSGADQPVRRACGCRVGRRRVPFRSCLSQAGPPPATSPVTCSSSTASPRTPRFQTGARRCRSPAISAGRYPIPGLVRAESRPAGHGWEVFSGLFHDRLWWEPVRAGLDLRPRAELAAKPPGPSRIFAIHPGWQAWRPPALNCPLARRHDHRSARRGPTDSRRRAAGHPGPRHLARRSRRSRARIDDRAGWLCGRLGAAAQGRAARGQRRS